MRERLIKIMNTLYIHRPATPREAACFILSELKPDWEGEAWAIDLFNAKGMESIYRSDEELKDKKIKVWIEEVA